MFLEFFWRFPQNCSMLKSLLINSSINPSLIFFLHSPLNLTVYSPYSIQIHPTLFYSPKLQWCAKKCASFNGTYVPKKMFDPASLIALAQEFPINFQNKSYCLSSRTEPIFYQAHNECLWNSVARLELLVPDLEPKSSARNQNFRFGTWNQI
jgi:hypothetical protein